MNETSSLQDKTLVKIIHEEKYRGYHIGAMISKFGGLDVIVFEKSESGGDDIIFPPIWKGFNIISARIWLDKHLVKQTGENR